MWSDSFSRMDRRLHLRRPEGLRRRREQQSLPRSSICREYHAEPTNAAEGNEGPLAAQAESIAARATATVRSTMESNTLIDPHPILGLVILVLSLLQYHRRIEMKPTARHAGIYYQNGHLALGSFYACRHCKLRIRPFWGSSPAAIRPNYAHSRLIESRPHGSQAALRG